MYSNSIGKLASLLFPLSTVFVAACLAVAGPAASTAANDHEGDRLSPKTFGGGRLMPPAWNAGCGVDSLYIGLRLLNIDADYWHLIDGANVERMNQWVNFATLRRLALEGGAEATALDVTARDTNELRKLLSGRGRRVAILHLRSAGSGPEHLVCAYLNRSAEIEIAGQSSFQPEIRDVWQERWSGSMLLLSRGPEGTITTAPSATAQSVISQSTAPWASMQTPAATRPSVPTATSPSGETGMARSVRPAKISASTPRSPNAGAGVRMEPANLDRGNVKIGASFNYQFVVRNDGSHPVDIKAVHVSCPCINYTLDARTIAPGATTLLHGVVVASQVPGVVAGRILLITSNPRQQQVIASLTWNVAGLPVGTFPNEIVARNVAPGGVRNVELDVRLNSDKAQIDDLEVVCSDDWIRCSLNPKTSKVAVALRPNWNGGERKGTISLRLKSIAGELQVPVRVGALPFFKTVPGRIFVEGRAAGAREPLFVHVGCTFPGSTLEITRTALEGLAGTATARRDVGSGEWIVELGLDLRPKPPLETGELIIHTTNTVAPEVRVPVTINWLN
jgi:hypothetical protein